MRALAAGVRNVAIAASGVSSGVCLLLLISACLLLRVLSASSLEMFGDYRNHKPAQSQTHFKLELQLTFILLTKSTIWLINGLMTFKKLFSHYILRNALKPTFKFLNKKITRPISN